MHCLSLEVGSFSDEVREALPEGVFEMIVVEMVELLADDSDQTADRHVVFCQGFCSMHSLAHSIQYANNIKSNFGDFGCVIGLVSFRDYWFLEQQCC